MAATKAQEAADRHLQHYPWLEPLTTRWSDNDQYGHVNNSIYYQYFDAIANSFLIRSCGLVPVDGEPPLPAPASPSSTASAAASGTISGSGRASAATSGAHGAGSKTREGGDPIGLVVSSSCRYHASVEFPRRLLAGLAVAKLGKSSVTYRLAIFDAEVLPGAVFAKVAAQPGYPPNSSANSSSGSGSTSGLAGSAAITTGGDARIRDVDGVKVQAACVGFFTHVFVDRHTRRPTAMTPRMRGQFEKVQALEAAVRNGASQAKL